jgi:hypothetical protein
MRAKRFFTFIFLVKCPFLAIGLWFGGIAALSAAPTIVDHSAVSATDETALFKRLKIALPDSPDIKLRGLSEISKGSVCGMISVEAPDGSDSGFRRFAYDSLAETFAVWHSTLGLSGDQEQMAQDLDDFIDTICPLTKSGSKS